MRNRAAALASRERKREHVMRLETTLSDIEGEKMELRMIMGRMNEEIKRLRTKLLGHGIHDHGEDFIIPEVRMIEHIDTMEDEPLKVKTGPTGFSPRGALKKDQILANQAAAEEHLRLVTKRQAAGKPDETRDERDRTRGANSFIMILIFGIALFATIPQASLSSWTSERTNTFLNLPNPLNSVPSETVISQLRDQGFMKGEELKERGLGIFIPTTKECTLIPKSFVKDRNFALMKCDEDGWTPFKID